MTATAAFDGNRSQTAARSTEAELTVAGRDERACAPTTHVACPSFDRDLIERWRVQDRPADQPTYQRTDGRTGLVDGRRKETPMFAVGVGVWLVEAKRVGGGKEDFRATVIPPTGRTHWTTKADACALRAPTEQTKSSGGDRARIWDTVNANASRQESMIGSNVSIYICVRRASTSSVV